MSFKKKAGKKIKGLKIIGSSLTKNLNLKKIKVNPINLIDETSNKLGNFYQNLKKKRGQNKKKNPKKRRHWIEKEN